MREEEGVSGGSQVRRGQGRECVLYGCCQRVGRGDHHGVSSCLRRLWRRVARRDGACCNSPNTPHTTNISNITVNHELSPFRSSSAQSNPIRPLFPLPPPPPPPHPHPELTNLHFPAPTTAFPPPSSPILTTQSTTVSSFLNISLFSKYKLANCLLV